MPIDTRKKNCNWSLSTNANGTTPNEHVAFALLMDLRDLLTDVRGELNSLNNLLHCPNFTAIPHKLDAIRRNTAKKRIARRPSKPIPHRLLSGTVRKAARIP